MLVPYEQEERKKGDACGRQRPLFLARPCGVLERGWGFLFRAAISLAFTNTPSPCSPLTPLPLPPALLRRPSARPKVEARLGSTSGASEIKSHAWFSDLDWDMVMEKKTTPEFSPSAGKGPDFDGSDATHFDEEFTSEKAIDSVVNTQLSATMVEKSKFEGFTFSGGALDEIAE